MNPMTLTRAQTFAPRVEAASTYEMNAIVARTEMRLRALTSSYEAECSRIRAEMLVAIKNIERQ